ncbi:hypothetical protein BGZ60DRAFT_394393 [Tricladium varicosporioides]|nr:hypothetical protein BGZ60DRAFT_394393 [Hymenoscyphus varicosporioides]
MTKRGPACSLAVCRCWMLCASCVRWAGRDDDRQLVDVGGLLWRPLKSGDALMSNVSERAANLGCFKTLPGAELGCLTPITAKDERLRRQA